MPPGRAAALRGPARVLETLKRDAVTELGGVLSGFWSEIEEQVRLASLACTISRPRRKTAWRSWC